MMELKTASFGQVLASNLYVRTGKENTLMNRISQPLVTKAVDLWNQAKVRKGFFRVIAALLILQVYFVRELLAAELLIALAFVVFMAIFGIVYAFGTLGELGIAATETGLRVAAEGSKRGAAALEQFGRESVRHFPTETAK
jgi:hypothetical protein